jgi:ADP-ribosylglycohydrolase
VVADQVGLADRAVGALLGLAVGDALGTTLEFSRRDSRPPVADMVGGGPFGLAPGQWTDDTSMALCLADSLLACNGIDQRDLMERFARWFMHGENSVTGRCFDIGNTTREAILRFLRSGDPVAGKEDANSAGNGSLMRLAPVAIFWCSAPAVQAEAAARAQSATTHGAAAAVDACAFFAGLLIEAIHGSSKAAVLAPRRFAGHPAIATVAAGGWHDKPRGAIESSGYVVHTLEAALWSVHRTNGFSEALLAANLGDDADTVAAVTGQLAGAIYGADAIPLAWRERLAWSESIQARANALYRQGLQAEKAAP